MVAVTKVTATYQRMNKQPAGGRVSFAPTSALRDSSGHVILPIIPVTYILNGDGKITVDLISPHDPSLAPSGALYVVTEEIDGAPPRTWTIDVPITSSVLQLADFAPAVPGPQLFEYALATVVQALSDRVDAIEGGLSGTDIDGGNAATVYP